MGVAEPLPFKRPPATLNPSRLFGGNITFKVLLDGRMLGEKKLVVAAGFDTARTGDGEGEGEGEGERLESVAAALS